LYGNGVAFPGGTVTFLFTDIEGSTRLLQELGDDYSQVVADHRRILRDVFQRSGGHEVDTQGDAFFYSFTRARDAVAAAVDGQRSLADHGWPQGAEVRVRMGLHTGEPTLGDEGYVGMDVVRAARICSAGHGGQILASETTRALVGNDLPVGVSVRDLGTQRLKDVQYEHVYELSLEEERQEFPPLKEEPQGRATALAKDFGKRIDNYVQRQLESAFSRALPDESPPEPQTRALPRLETERLILRAPVPEDAEPLAPMYADPEVMRYLGDGQTLTREQTARSVERMIKGWQADGFGLFTTVRKEDGVVIGRVGLIVWNPETWQTTRLSAEGPKELEVGYTIGKPYWGNGYATEAAAASRDFALQKLDAQRLIALIIHGNDASENVARKLGFEYERDIRFGRRDAKLFAYAGGNEPAR
jgi:RimJ/RimL family protein N-acetyltransferase/class 3 adenylate cyclase